MLINCTLLIFSGRPNPEWIIDDESVQNSLLALIQRLPARQPAPEMPSILGYQGCRFQIDGVQWSVRQGIVRQGQPGNLHFFSDPDHQLEKALLRTAPASYSTLADSLLASEF